MNYITPLVGAYAADVSLGRFQTILYFSSIYVVGMAACVAASYPDFVQGSRNMASAVFMLGLFGGVAFGAGGIKPNVVVLGADQFDMQDEEQRRQKDTFFGYFYWAINLGSTISYALLTGMAVDGIPAIGISKRDGFFFSFLIPAVCMAIAVLTFLAGSGRYKLLPPSGSALSVFTKILWSAAERTHKGKLVIAGIIAIMFGMVCSLLSFLFPACLS